MVISSSSLTRLLFPPVEHGDAIQGLCRFTLRLCFMSHEYLGLSEMFLLQSFDVHRLVQFLVQDAVIVFCFFSSELFYILSSIKNLNEPHQELLSMGSDVHLISGSDMLLDLLPVLAEEAKSFQEVVVFFFGPPPFG